jgi:hypothetical protein
MDCDYYPCKYVTYIIERALLQSYQSKITLHELPPFGHVMASAIELRKRYQIVDELRTAASWSIVYYFLTSFTTIVSEKELIFGALQYISHHEDRLNEGLVEFQLDIKVNCSD